MEKYIPLFPLNLVAYPGEELNLHIFEPRYRQLINECFDEDLTFGIPAFINEKLAGYGTEMQLVAIHKRYDDGRLDIKSVGQTVFKLNTFDNPALGKPYAGGQVELLAAGQTSGPYSSELASQLTRLYTLLQLEVDFAPTEPNLSYRVAHKVGLVIEQEYELLLLEDEADRQQFLIRHLDSVLPVVSEMERTKQRIQMNGHFKNLDPLTF